MTAIMPSCFLAGSIILAFIGFFLFCNKKFQRHPYKLVAGTCLIESALYNIMAAQGLMCTYPMDKWLHYSLFGG
jgi:hypothetical protein